MSVTTYCIVRDVSEFMTWIEIDEGDWPDEGLIQRHIILAASEINVAMMASNQLTCTKNDDVLGFLRLLNMIGAMLLTEFDNMRQLTDVDLGRYQAWKDKQLELIRTGQLSVCDGETGLEYPAFSTAEQALTPEAAAKILHNYILRSMP